MMLIKDNGKKKINSIVLREIMAVIDKLSYFSSNAINAKIK